ncbi:MAG TPA: hypothetical protein VLA91_17185 [Acidimicrobiia bacterium]|nr:hypothetical protein [Acidimicrobiia bacterium]
MRSPRMPAILLAVTAAAFAVWAAVLVASPGGPVLFEWFILGLAAGLSALGLVSLKSADRHRVALIRWLLTGFAVYGAVVVIGLSADDNSSRTWFRLGWAALVVGLVASLWAWWTLPRVDLRLLVGGGVVGVIVIAAGAGITLNCDKTLQRSWCDPVYEEEEALAARIEVDGAQSRNGRAGGDTGAYVRAFLVAGTDIGAVTSVPEPFVFEERPLQSVEVARGRYTATSGPYSNCQIDVKVEEVPAGSLQTLIVSCLSEG